MDGGSFTRVANGDIAPCRFVKLDTTADGRVLAAGAGDRPFGISQKATHNIAMSGGGFTQTDDGLAAKAGEMLNIHGQVGETCLLELGGTVTRGDLLKPGSAGVGVTGNTDKDKSGAEALASGVSGQLIPVKILRIDVSV